MCIGNGLLYTTSAAAIGRIHWMDERTAWDGMWCCTTYSVSENVEGRGRQSVLLREGLVTLVCVNSAVMVDRRRRQLLDIIALLHVVCVSWLFVL